MKKRDWIGIIALVLLLLGFEVGLLIYIEFEVVSYAATYFLWTVSWLAAMTYVGMFVVEVIRSMRGGSHKTPPP